MRVKIAKPKPKQDTLIIKPLREDFVNLMIGLAKRDKSIKKEEFIAPEPKPIDVTLPFLDVIIKFGSTLSISNYGGSEFNSDNEIILTDKSAYLHELGHCLDFNMDKFGIGSRNTTNHKFINGFEYAGKSENEECLDELIAEVFSLYLSYDVKYDEFATNPKEQSLYYISGYLGFVNNKNIFSKSYHREKRISIMQFVLDRVAQMVSYLGV